MLVNSWILGMYLKISKLKGLVLYKYVEGTGDGNEEKDRTSNSNF